MEPEVKNANDAPAEVKMSDTKKSMMALMEKE